MFNLNKTEEKRLFRNLNRYTNKNDPYYDPVFDAKIREIAPQWFNKDLRKLFILAHKKFNLSHKHPLWKTFIRTTKKNSTTYNVSVDKKLRELVPEWYNYWNNQKKLKQLNKIKYEQDIIKNLLKSKYRETELHWTKPIGRKFLLFTNPISKYYDKNFVAELQNK